jgi:hypothetical protein
MMIHFCPSHVPRIIVAELYSITAEDVTVKLLLTTGQDKLANHVGFYTKTCDAKALLILQFLLQQATNINVLVANRKYF